MATVRDTDLPDLLISLGYQVKRIGRYYTTQEMDSIRIKDRRTWFRYYAVEIEAPEDYQLDDTPHYFEVKDGKTSQLTVTNKAFSGILLHKIDADTRKGIYGVTFLLYDGNMNPVDQFTTDQNGYAYHGSIHFLNINPAWIRR